MRRIFIVLGLALCPMLAHAWNAAGHRLAAYIAWTQMTPATQQFVTDALRAHPDSPNWAARAKSSAPRDLFAEASTWPDDIRHDPRFYDEEREPPTPPLPGFSDTARHRRWHYIDLNADGRVRDGELDRQIDRLTHILRSTGKMAEISYALPWLAHLVADIHQPLHVGRHGDAGGNEVQIENPFNKRQPFTSLHTYWDDLPGPPWLRHRRLAQNAGRLLDDFPPPLQGSTQLWRNESHQLLDQAYPQESGSLLPIISEGFHRRARDLANRRILEAGYRLGRLLEAIHAARVSRETP